MTRVLVLCEFSTLNGGERSLLAMLPGLQARGFELLVGCPAAGDLPRAVVAAGARHVPCNFRNERGVRIGQPALRERLDQLIGAVRPGLVHANSVATGRLAGPVVRARRVPNLGHLRDMISLSATGLQDLAAHQRLLAVSEATRRWYAAAGMPPTLVHVLPNGVDLTRFQPRVPTGWLHRELGLPAAAELVGAIGQLGMRKGLDVLLEALCDVIARRPAVHGLLIGQRYSQKEEARDYERRLHEMAQRPPLRGHLHFLGCRDDVPRILNELTVLTHAARQEPLGRVLLEAAAAGIPVVATDVGGTREIFPPETNSAVLVPPDSAPPLAHAILRLLDKPAARTALARAARQSAESRYRDCDVAAQLAQHYRELVDR